MEESEIIYNNKLMKNKEYEMKTSQLNSTTNSSSSNILDNLISPYRKCELILALLGVKRRNLIELRERIEKLLQLARQDAENDSLNKNFVGSMACAIKCYVTQGGQYNCEIEKEDKCFEKGLQKIMSSLPEKPKCHPTTLLYKMHQPEEVFLENTKFNWKKEYAIPNENDRIKKLEKRLPGLPMTSPTNSQPNTIKKNEKPSFLRKKPSYSFLRNSSSSRTIRSNMSSDISRSSGGGSLLKKSNVPRRNMMLDIEEVNRLAQIQEEEKRLAQKKEEAEKLAAEKEKERKKKEEMARKQKEKEEKERERMEKRQKRQKELEEEKKRKEALKEAKEREAKEKEKRRQEAMVAAKEAKEKEAREKEIRKAKEREAKEKEKRERILQRENSTGSPIKRRIRKKRKTLNDSNGLSINNYDDLNTPSTATSKNQENDFAQISSSVSSENSISGMNSYSNQDQSQNQNSYSNTQYLPQLQQSNQYQSNDNNNNTNDHNININNQKDQNQQQSINYNSEEDNRIRDPEGFSSSYKLQSPTSNSTSSSKRQRQRQQQQPSPLQPPSSQSTQLSSLPPSSQSQQQQQPPLLNNYSAPPTNFSKILGNANQLSPEDRQFIIDFLNGKIVASPNESSRIIPLNVEVYQDHEANLSIREIIEFEMDFKTGTWRKLKKTRKTQLGVK